MKFKNEAKELENTLQELEVKLGNEFGKNKVSVQSANNMADMISEAKSKVKEAANNINALVQVQNIIQKIKCKI